LRRIGAGQRGPIVNPACHTIHHAEGYEGVKEEPGDGGKP
jgi:hypothetical protein